LTYITQSVIIRNWCCMSSS